MSVALMAGDEFTEYFADAAMAAREFDHSFRKRRAPEVSIKLSPHLRSPLQFAPEVFAPAPFVIQRRARQIRIGEEFPRTQRVVNAFAGDWVGEAGGITEQRPTSAASVARVPGARRQAGNARRVAFGSFLEFK